MLENKQGGTKCSYASKNTEEKCWVFCRTEMLSI